MHMQALNIAKAALGDGHPDVAQSMNNMAGLLVDMGMQREALPMYEKALAIFKNALGNEHPDVGMGLSNLAMLSADLGKRKEALPMLEEALAIYTTAYGASVNHHHQIRFDQCGLRFLRAILHRTFLSLKYVFDASVCV